MEPAPVESASFGRRLLALVIDWLVAALSASALAGVSYPPEDLQQNLIITAFYVLEVGLTVGLLGFSIGKRVVSLKVENPDGRPIGPLQGLLRSALVCLVVPPIVTNGQGRGLHDVVTGSREVRV